MFGTAEKTSKPITVNRKAEGGSFFGKQLNSSLQASSHLAHPFFQSKLSVSTPGDPYELEADATADAVMRMSEPASTPMQQEDEQVQRMAAENEPIAVPAIATMLQRNATVEDDRLQAKENEERQEENRAERIAQPMLQRTEDAEEESVQAMLQCNAFSMVSSNRSPTFGVQPKHTNSKSLHRSGQSQLIGLQGSSRGPPSVSPQFEQTLQQRTAGGNALPEPTRNFMESRFGADFSGVRVHNDASAQEMSSSIRAHAFTYNNHIFFNSGKFDTDSSGGKALLAHELTHTIQQGASPVASNIARKHQFTAVQSKAIQASSAPQKEAAVALARGEQGKVIANKSEPNGERVGADRLVDYFKTTFGEDKIVNHYTGAPNTVVESLIRKKTTTMGQVPNQPDPNVQVKRDAMPSWCGIFVFWALNKAGIPMPKWKLGMPMMKPEATYPPGYTPQAGDIAYRAKNSHYGIVTGIEGGKIKSVNGNTAGVDNLGGEIQEQVHEPSQWQGFFNPLALATGPLSDATATDQAQQASTAPARSLRELRKAKYRAQRKEDGGETNSEAIENEAVPRLQMSSWKVNSHGALQRNSEGEIKEEETSAGETVQRSEAPTATSESERKEGAIQTKTEASARHHFIMTKAEAAARIHRSTNGIAMVQGGWFDDAWDAVSGAISEVAEWVEQGLDAAKDWLLGKVRDFVLEIPGYRLLRYILGFDPITGEAVVKTPEALLEAVIGLIPLYGRWVRPVLDYFNATMPVADWLFTAVNRFVGLLESIGNRFEVFWDGLSLSDVSDPDGVLRRVADLFTSIVRDVLLFVDEAASTFLSMVKNIALTNIGQFVQSRFPNAFDLLCVVLGQNPITQENVPRNGSTIMNAGLNLLGERGAQIRQQIMQNGIHAKAVEWIDRAIQVVTDTVANITNLFSNVWGEITFESLFTPVETFMRIAEHFTRPITRVTSFISDAVVALLRILKDALLGWLSRTAHDARGYYLITVIIGRDPFTNATVERNAENLIHGFMSLMEGGEEQFRQMKESGAIERTTQKIMLAVRSLNFTWAYIVGLFTRLWNTMDWTDFLNPIAAFARIIGTFIDPVRRLVTFVVEIIKIVVEVLLIVMNFPIDVVNNIFRRIVQVIGLIRRDPIGFLKNLLRAIKQGFVQFFNNILQHLLRGLADWLFGQLGAIGIQMPADLSFRSILNLVMQILGIALNQIMDRVWRKLAERIGQERVDKIRRMTDRLEGIWRFVREVMERGPIAIWEYIQEQLSNLWDTVIDSIKNWIMERVINAMMARLLSLLDPTGIMAVVNSVIAIYRAIQSAIEYLRQMLEIVNSFVNGIAEIATGNIQVAADYLERTAARFVPVMIGFLANQVGLNRIAGRIIEMIERVRGLVSSAIDWLIDRALNMGMPIINGILAVIEGGERLVERGRAAVTNAVSTIANWAMGIRRRFSLRNGEGHSLYFENRSGRTELMVASTPTPLRLFIANLRIPPNRMNAEVAQDRTSANHFLDEVDRVLYNTPAGMSELQKTQAIEHNLVLAGEHIARLMEASGGSLRQSTRPVFAGLHGGYGRGMRVEIVNAPITTGSDAGATSAEWTALVRRKELRAGGRSYFVRGHLVSQHLGGDGNIWENLTPLTQTANQDHETRIENPLKQRVDRNADHAFIYVVTPAYGRGVQTNLISDLHQPGSPIPVASRPAIEAIIRGEQYVPTSLACTISEVDPMTGEELPSDISGTHIVANPIAQNTLSDYII